MAARRRRRRDRAARRLRHDAPARAARLRDARARRQALARPFRLHRVPAGGAARAAASSPSRARRSDSTSAPRRPASSRSAIASGCSGADDYEVDCELDGPARVVGRRRPVGRQSRDASLAGRARRTCRSRRRHPVRRGRGGTSVPDRTHAVCNSLRGRPRAAARRAARRVHRVRARPNDGGYDLDAAIARVRDRQRRADLHRPAVRACARQAHAAGRRPRSRWTCATAPRGWRSTTTPPRDDERVFRPAGRLRARLRGRCAASALGCSASSRTCPRRSNGMASTISHQFKANADARDQATRVYL